MFQFHEIFLDLRISFFAQFSGNGTEGMEPDFLGYTCQWIGNLDCPDFSFQCSGSGIIDCTGNCPGDAETFDSMIKMINNASLAEEFPLIAEIQKKSQNSTPEGKEKMLSMLRGCNVDGSFEKTISRMSGLFGKSFNIVLILLSLSLYL